MSWTEPWLFDKPYSLFLSVFASNYTTYAGAVAITDNNSSIHETAQYERNQIGLSAGVGHRFWVNWQHYHRYTPSYYNSTNPSSLVSNQILAQVARGWQFKSQLTNGLVFDKRDNIFNPTSGFMASFSLDNVGQYLGGNSHYDRYSPIIDYYHSWFDYTLFGLFRKNSLRRWRVVQEFRFSGSFTYERIPKYGVRSDPLRQYLEPGFDPRIANPYIQVQDYLYMGGVESLRGYNYQDRHFPVDWWSGAAHRTLVSSELRFPIEPSMLWLVTFLDGGSMYENVNKFYGDRLNALNTYRANVNQLQTSNPALYYLQANYNSYGQKINESSFELNDPGKLVLSSNNISMDRFRWSWGFGLRIQIPVLPLRLYFAQKLQFTGDANHPFTKYADDPKFNFVFGIGDIKF